MSLSLALGPLGQQGGSRLRRAILALSPLSYWTLRGNDADTLVDLGSLGYDLTEFGAVSFDTITGPDGNYVAGPALGTSYLYAPDDNAYEPQNDAGLTVFFLMYHGSTSTGVVWPVHKYVGGTGGSWSVNMQNTGWSLATTYTAANAQARSAFNGSGFSAAVGWRTWAARFPNTSTGYPTLRIDGTNMTGTTNTGTSQANSAQQVRIAGNGLSAGTLGTVNGVAHVAIFNGQLSDAQLTAIEDAAASDGW